MTWEIKVIQIEDVKNHPNADRLDIATVEGTPVIIRRDEYKSGDKAVYIPIDSIVPDNERFEFLKGHRKIKAKKLRGVFSMGLLTPAESKWKVGQDVQEELEIKKYDPVADIEFKMSPNAEVYPGSIIKYDIDNLRKSYNLFEKDEEVYITEKIHGANSRFVYKDGRLWCGSRKLFNKYDENNMWWRLAKKYNLEEKLKHLPEIAIYGEAYGSVQDLKYGLDKGEVNLILFDVLDTINMKWLDVDDYINLVDNLGLPRVPALYRGPLPDKDTVFAMAEGNSTLENANHVREGIVIRPAKERNDYRGNRIILKLPGEGYLLRKEK